MLVWVNSSHSLSTSHSSNNCIGKTHAVFILYTTEIDLLSRALQKMPLMIVSDHNFCADKCFLLQPLLPGPVPTKLLCAFLL